MVDEHHNVEAIGEMVAKNKECFNVIQQQEVQVNEPLAIIPLLLNIQARVVAIGEDISDLKTGINGLIMISSQLVLFKSNNSMLYPNINRFAGPIRKMTYARFKRLTDRQMRSFLDFYELQVPETRADKFFVLCQYRGVRRVSSSLHAFELNE